MGSDWMGLTLGHSSFALIRYTLTIFISIFPKLTKILQEELYRTDSDGEMHYSPEAILNGDVILAMQGEAKDYGYWGTLPPNPTRDSKIYPNPLFVKLTRELWARSVHTFIIIQIP